MLGLSFPDCAVRWVISSLQKNPIVVGKMDITN